MRPGIEWWMAAFLGLGSCFGFGSILVGCGGGGQVTPEDAPPEEATDEALDEAAREAGARALEQIDEVVGRRAPSSRPPADDRWAEVMRAGRLRARGAAGSPADREEIVRALESSSALLRSAALDVTWSMDAPSLVAPVARMARSETDPVLRQRALRRLGDLAGRIVAGESPAGDDWIHRVEMVTRVEEAEETLVHRLQREAGAGARSAAASGLGLLGRASARAVGALWNAAGDPDEAVRIEVAWALGALGSPRGIEPLGSLARDEVPLVRGTAAWAAGAIAAPGSARLLAWLAEDPDPEVRSFAAVGAGELGGPEGRAILARLAEDPSSVVRDGARRARAGLEPVRSARRALDGAWWMGE